LRQLTCKIVDPDVNGGLRYKAWTHHRDRVLDRLGGWQLIAQGPDFATFSIPQVQTVWMSSFSLCESAVLFDVC